MIRSLLAVLLAAAGTSSAAESPGHALAGHDPARIQADVARLAGSAWEGRRAGTEGADRAADWIATEFEKAGLRPAGEAGSWFQSFSFIDGVVLGPGNRLMSSRGDRWIAQQDFQPLAFSAPGAASGEVVFAGYGVVAKDLGVDDYAGIDVKDRVVLVLRYGPEGDDPQSKWAGFTALRHKAATARDEGARALLVVSGPRTTGVADALVPLKADASFADAGIPVFSVRRTVADALLAASGTTLEAAQRKVDEAGPASFLVPGVRVELTSDVTPSRSTTRNVLGRIDGTTGEVVVVGAHYDHLGLGVSGSLDPQGTGKVHPGADDNASGASALLSLARSLAAGGPKRRAVLFAAFGAEEIGTLGSSHFVKSPPVPLERVVAMVNMDMVGRLREDALDVHGVGTSPGFKALVEDVAKASGIKARVREGGYGPSDHNSFYVAGRPVLFFFTGSHAEYHKPSDTADTVNAQGIARVAGLVESIVTRLAASADPLPFTRVAAEKEASASPARGFRVWVGGIPDYSEEGIGVRFSGVTPGSPAEKAGVRTGDVLLRFGGKEIRNIYDYTYALAERRPGDVVSIVVRREGGEVALDVTLGARPGEAR